jgi:tetratricopeptide (TPR) repeat protein
MSSPSRFQHDLLLENEDEGDHMRLRNPQPTSHDVLSPQAALVLQGTAAPGAPSQNNDRMEVCVLEALQHSAGEIGVGCFDLRLIQAERLFNEQNYLRAYEVIKAVVEADFYYVNIVPLYCAVLIELNKVGEIYYIAHKLVSANPDLAVAWFAVGSYYFLIKKYDLARKYFNKANRLDKHFAASWIAFGHAFAA